MIHFPAWRKWNAKYFRSIRSKRTANGTAQDAPLQMDYVTIAANLDESDEFRDFAEAVGPRLADGFLLRALSYAARSKRNALWGEIHLSREKFRKALETEVDDIVPKALGRKVFDALLASGIAAHGPHPERPQGGADGASHGSPHGEPSRAVPSGSGSGSGSHSTEPPNPQGGAGVVPSDLPETEVIREALVDWSSRRSSNPHHVAHSDAKRIHGALGRRDFTPDRSRLLETRNDVLAKDPTAYLRIEKAAAKRRPA